MQSDHLLQFGIGKSFICTYRCFCKFSDFQVLRNDPITQKTCMSETFKLRYGITAFATKRFLYQIGILDSPNCIYCNEEESITHAFFFCPYIKRFWNKVETF